MSDTIPERLATLETQNHQCAAEREEHGDTLKELLALTHGVRGSIKTLVVLWALVSSAGGAALLRYAFDHTPPASAAIHAP